MPTPTHRPTGIARMRGAQPAGKSPASSTGLRDRPLPPPLLSEEAAHQDRLDDAQFTKQATEYAKATTTRPALFVEADIEMLRRTYPLGSTRLEMLTKIKSVREALLQEERGETPITELSAANRAKAKAFFDTHGRRLADAPRVAPPNPIKPAGPAAAPRPAVATRAERDRLDAEAKAAEAEKLLAAAAAAPVATPAPAMAATITPASAEVLALLRQIVESDKAQSKQIMAMATEVKSLREQLASAPAQVASAGPAGETVDFLMSVIAVGANENNGARTYKAKGGQFTKHGVKIWDEILPELGIDAGLLEFGDNKLGRGGLPAAMMVRALVVAGEDGKARAKKVVGLAK